MSFLPLSELSVTNKTLYPATPFNLVVTSEGWTLRDFACALGTSRPALLHFRLIFIEHRSSVPSVQRTCCSYFHENVYFREDSLSLPAAAAGGGCREECSGFSGTLVLKLQDWQKTFVRVTLNFNVKNKTGKRDYRPHFVRIPDSRRLKGIGMVEGIGK